MPGRRKGAEYLVPTLQIPLYESKREPKECEHSVMNAQVQAMGERERRKMEMVKKKKRMESRNRGNNMKRQKIEPEIVIIDSENEDCVVIDDENLSSRK